ncbi:MAG: homoserine O-succinyltransferase [Roseibium sp.]|uniref:homoserine O-succinyltransferase n=1 Tax=Roseibium sp. TaxID=1936156 RepID=UPI0026112B6D|nr:homoserine O-succinyltransferase [Roseibium sp.]MCV0425394.1 homoserine O-succinyltransferase [Roseibium sp.]
MPIKVSDNLPARRSLESEGVIVMREAEAVRQDIRPLRIGLLNLMPNKIKTETQIARLLGATPLQIELTLVRMTDHVPQNTPAEHMEAFYRPWADIRDERFDGFIVTGAPVEKRPFLEVRYWPELAEVFDWTQTHVHRCFMICWAAQAAVHHFHDVPKHLLPEKRFGVYKHRNLAPTSPYLRGFCDEFEVPVSRWTENRHEDIPAESGLRILAENEESGLCLLEDPHRRTLLMFNHLEYDTETLGEEFVRDGGGRLPLNYFPDDNPALPPENKWRGHAHLLFGNWINDIYQTTPFDVNEIGQVAAVANGTTAEVGA